MTPLRVAVVGCGDIAAVHLDAILDAAGAELVGVCDVDEERRAAAAARGNCAGFPDLTAMLDWRRATCKDGREVPPRTIPRQQRRQSQ